MDFIEIIQGTLGWIWKAIQLISALICVCVCVLPLKLPSMTVCECQSSYALCMIRIIFTRKHGSSESVRLCMSLLDLSFIRRSYTISIHLYLPVPTSPCLPAPHLLVILGNGGVCTPTLSPNHHSVCFSAPICVCVYVCVCGCVQADPKMFLSI